MTKLHNNCKSGRTCYWLPRHVDEKGQHYKGSVCGEWTTDKELKKEKKG